MFTVDNGVRDESGLFGKYSDSSLAFKKDSIHLLHGNRDIHILQSLSGNK
jgi:hypothetical protein